MRYGTDGYAIYFHCLELIAGDLNENNITFELEHDAEIIADNLKIKGTQTVSAVDRVNEIMRYIIELQLFECKNEHIFCFKMLHRLDTSMTSNSRLRNIISDAKGHHDKVMIKSCKNRLDKNRIDNTSEELKTERPIEADKLAILLYDLHKSIDPGYQVGDTQLDSWSNEIDKINRIDGRDYETIEKVLRWAKADSFWKANIMSGKKLREKFPNLLAKMPKQVYSEPSLSLKIFEPSQEELDMMNRNGGNDES